MLNAKALSALLSRNRDDRLCKRWYLMTPNGTLLAYSQPTNIHDLRNHAALTALSWQEQARAAQGAALDEPAPALKDVSSSDALHFLAIESENANIIVQKLQSQLLLVLEGGVPPRRSAFERTITAETESGASISPHPLHTHHREPSPSEVSYAESSASNISASVLQMQRKKLDTLAHAIVAEFEQTGFQMPDDGNAAYF